MTNGNRPAILGIGTDILEIEKIRKSFVEHGERMFSKLFTPQERAYCLKHQDPVPRITGRFCAKEAIVKALGTGMGKEIGWLDIEILNEESGKPIVSFSEKLHPKLRDTQVLVSISHCDLYASAFAIWVAT